MLIHTFEATVQLSNEKFYAIQSEVKSDHKWTRRENGMTYFGAKDDGILIRFSRSKKRKFKGYWLKYIISARRVMEPNNYIGLFDIADYQKLIEKVNRKLKKICPMLPKIETCSVSRIDFCVNAYLDNQELVKAYVKLAKRCRMPHSLEHSEEYYDKKTKETKRRKDEMTVSSQSYMELSIYNKYAQMHKETNYPYPSKQLEKAKPILRLEVRCMEDKIKHLRKRYKERFPLYTIKDFLIHGEEIGEYLYEYYLSKMFCHGDFYTLPEARQRVQMSGYDEKTREAMIDLLEEANTARSLNKACKLFADERVYGKKYMKYLLFKFDQIQTSPITVPREIQKVFGDVQIPHPLELFHAWNDDAQ